MVATLRLDDHVLNTLFLDVIQEGENQVGSFFRDVKVDVDHVLRSPCLLKAVLQDRVHVLQVSQFFVIVAQVEKSLGYILKEKLESFLSGKRVDVGVQHQALTGKVEVATR